MAFQRTLGLLETPLGFTGMGVPNFRPEMAPGLVYAGSRKLPRGSTASYPGWERGDCLYRDCINGDVAGAGAAGLVVVFTSWDDQSAFFLFAWPVVYGKKSHFHFRRTVYAGTLGTVVAWRAV
jgi:hypothetical protein